MAGEIYESMLSARVATAGEAVEIATRAMAAASEKISKDRVLIHGLREKLAEYEESFQSIYSISGRFSARNWDIVPRSHLGATLKLINKECERVVPSLNKFSEE